MSRENAGPVDVLRAANGPFDEVSRLVREAKALADLLQLANDNNEPERESIMGAAAMLFNKMGEAQNQLDALWVAIGGEAS